MTSSCGATLALFRICMLESCDKLWSYFVHFALVNQRFSLKRAKDASVRLKRHSGIDSSTCNGLEFHVLNLR